MRGCVATSVGELLAAFTEFGLVEAELSRVVAWLMARAAGWGERPRSHSVTFVSVSDLRRALEPLTQIPKRTVLFQVGRWTGFLENSATGTDGMGAAAIAQGLSCRGVRACWATRNGFEARIFELYGPEQREFLNYERTIAVVADEGEWTFSQTGQPLSFEEGEWLRRRPVSARFMGDELLEMLRQLGVAFDPEEGKGAVVEW